MDAVCTKRGGGMLLWLLSSPVERDGGEGARQLSCRVKSCVCVGGRSWVWKGMDSWRGDWSELNSYRTATMTGT